VKHIEVDRYKIDAVKVLKEASETFLIDLFSRANYVSTKYNRQGIDMKSMDCACVSVTDMKQKYLNKPM
jgi:histone H3/H4